MTKFLGENNGAEQSGSVNNFGNAVKIDLPLNITLDEAVELLLKKKEEGIKCFINFCWTIIDSANTNNIDDAYLQYLWITKSEHDAELDEERRTLDEWTEKRRIEKSILIEKQKEQEWKRRERVERERWYAKRIEESREWKEITITMDKVIAWLKFIAEHPKMEPNELIDNLINLGCNFTFEDIDKQCPKGVLLHPGMAEWNMWCGASVIAMCMSYGYAADSFFAFDHDSSAYSFIRKVTGDDTYTKEYVDSLIKEGK